MIVALPVLILSLALFFFYFQVTCRKILRRPFEREYYRAIANAHRLEFPALRRELEVGGSTVDYPRLRRALECDFLALTYLLKNAANVKQRYSYEERLLILDFQWESLSLVLRRSLRLGGNRVILRLTSILQYFANVVGRRVDSLKLGHLSAAG
jgi:hypothetical protein